MAPVTRSHWRLYIAGAGTLKEKRTSAGLELKLQPPFDRPRRSEREHPGSRTDAVGPTSLHGTVDRTGPAVQLTNQSVSGGVKVGKVEQVKHAHAWDDREPLMPEMPDPAEFHVKCFQPSKRDLTRNYSRNRCACRVRKGNGGGHAAQRLQLSQSEQAVVDQHLTCGGGTTASTAATTN